MDSQNPGGETWAGERTGDFEGSRRKAETWGEMENLERGEATEGAGPEVTQDLGREVARLTAEGEPVGQELEYGDAYGQRKVEGKVIGTDRPRNSGDRLAESYYQQVEEIFRGDNPAKEASEFRRLAVEYQARELGRMPGERNDGSNTEIDFTGRGA